MSIRIAVGLSESFDAVEAFSEASADAARKLGAPCDLAVVFASGPHIGHAKWVLSVIHERLEPVNLIGCAAGGVLAGGQEIEDGPGAVVWAMSAPDARIATHYLSAERHGERTAIVGIPDKPGGAMLLMADPYSFPTEALLARLDELYPGIPVIGGLASAAVGGRGVLLRDGDLCSEGAVVCTLDGVSLLPCVSQGAAPVGPEMRVTAAEGNLIAELAGKPAVQRLTEVIGALDEEQQQLARSGVVLGIVIDENKPEFERGDFLVRPIIGADQTSGTIAVGERVRIGQTIRLHVRDPASADEDLREALRTQSEALGAGGAAGALLFTCNGRGAHMFSVPDHDAGAVADALGAPAGGFFCAGEIGPVGGRNFLHGFTATIAVFPAS
jgi:small ligand-binding sensory domain FIST